MAELNASAWLAAQQESRASDRDSRERERARDQQGKSFERSKEKQQKILYNLTDTHLALIA